MKNLYTKSMRQNVDCWIQATGGPKKGRLYAFGGCRVDDVLGRSIKPTDVQENERQSSEELKAHLTKL